MRRRLLLSVFVVSVRPSVCHVAELGFTVQKWLNGSRNSVLDGGGGFDAAFSQLLWPLVCSGGMELSPSSCHRLLLKLDFLYCELKIYWLLTA